MSAPEGRPDRAIAERLASALERALGGAPARPPLEAARDAARVVGLEGLGRVLAALVPFGGRRWPAEALPVCERVRALSRTARATGSLDPLRRAEAEMEEAAERLGPLTREAGDRAPTGVLTLAEAVGPMRADEELMARAHDVRLTTPVAAALRAALDWLAGERMPLRFAVDDSALEIVLDRVNFGGLEAADRVLRDVGGNIGPALEGAAPGAQPRPWIMRLPTIAPRPSYLMVVQGGLRLAIPWAAVLRLRMAGAAALEGRDRVLGLPVVAPLVTPLADAPYRPAVVVASGWKRACMVADRLVWRMTADTCDAGMAPTPALSGAVRTEDGDLYWVVDPVTLLESVAPPAPVEPPAAPAEPPASRPGGRGPAPAPRPAEPVAEPAMPLDELPPEEFEPLDALGPGDVEPIEEWPGDVAPVDPGAAPPGIAPEWTGPGTATHGRDAPVAPPSSAPADPRAGEPRASEGDRGPTGPPPHAGAHPAARGGGAAPAAGRVLVAEDSIAARIFLTRMLESEGFEVQAVARAADLFLALEGGWRLVCVDVELPDGWGPDLLRRVVRGAGGATPVVALVRDADDRSVARAAGIVHTLRKPFEREDLARLLTGLGIVPEHG